jgi:2',3'-cyclic-nucleotide 2'-phosphodiesterase (5'-nucleotidase family)
MSPNRAPALAAATLATVVALAGAVPRAHAADAITLCTLNDVKGKTSPCGCHVPKGGLARQAWFVDSLRALGGPLWLVDNGGFSPEEPERRDAAPFLMDALQLLKVDAVGVGDRDLRFGYAFLRVNAARAGVPMVSSNLIDRASGKPAFATSIVTVKDGVKVGFFSLVSPRADLGPGKDSLQVEDPVATAQRMVKELRKRGAHVVVALSNLGKVDSEDLCTAVEGIDVVVCGRNVPLIQKGRVIKSTLAIYGGEQGQHIGHAVLALDGRRRITAMDADVVALGPDVRDKAELASLVQAFEGHLAEKRAKAAP